MSDRERWDVADTVITNSGVHIIYTAQKLVLDEVVSKVDKLQRKVDLLVLGTNDRLAELPDDESDHGARLAAIVKDTLKAVGEMQEVVSDRFLPIAKNQRNLLDLERERDRDWSPEHFTVATRIANLCNFWGQVIHSFKLWVNDVARATPEQVDRLERVSGLAAFLRGWGVDRWLPEQPQSAGKAAACGAGAGVAAGAVAGLIAAYAAGAGRFGIVGAAAGGVALTVMAAWCLVAWLGRVCSKANYRALQADCRAARLAMEACRAQQMAERELLRVMEEAVSGVTVCLDQGELRYASELGECNVCLHTAAVDTRIYVCGREVCSTKHYTCEACYRQARECHMHRVCHGCQQPMLQPSVLTIRL